MKELYSMQAKRNYSPYYYLVTKKGWAIIFFSLTVGTVFGLALPFSEVLRLGIFLGTALLAFKAASMQFPVKESDVRDNFLQRWNKRKWKSESGCEMQRITEMLRRRGGDC